MSQEHKIIGGPSLHDIKEQLFARPADAHSITFKVHSSSPLDKDGKIDLSVYIVAVCREDGSGYNYLIDGYSGDSKVKLYYNTHFRAGHFLT